MTTLQFTDHPAARTQDVVTSLPSQSWVARFGRSLYAGLCASGQARARSQMLQFAHSCEPLQPTLAAELRAASAHIDAA